MILRRLRPFWLRSPAPPLAARPRYRRRSSSIDPAESLAEIRAANERNGRFASLASRFGRVAVILTALAMPLA